MDDFGISEPWSTKQHAIVLFDSLAVDDGKGPYVRDIVNVNLHIAQ